MDASKLYENVQMQVFYDNSCTEWTPNGRQMMGMSDADLGKFIKQTVRNAVSGEFPTSI